MIRAGMNSDSEAPETPKVRFAVISDVHAVTGNAERHETHAREETKDDPSVNPFAAVRRLIEHSQQENDQEPLLADALLCPGDLANRMNKDGLRYAWEELKTIADLLGAERVIATAGNHDIVRLEDMPEDADDDAWVASLRALTPEFPSADSSEAQRYFLDDFTVVEGERWRVVALNSCASYTNPGQSWHGKIEEKTLQHIEAKIGASRKDVNILMCHHHPVEWAHLSSKDTSYMEGGNKLMGALERNDPGRWIVLHGHRHVPALGYAGEASSGPVRMSAGSLAVLLGPQGRGDATNQFYTLEFDLDETASLDLIGAGRFRAWDWAQEKGMTPAAQSTELPGSGGFGFRRDAHDLASMCKTYLAQEGRRSATWQELLDDNPRWAYVAPRDLSMLRRTLELDGALVEPPDGRANIEGISFAAQP